MHHYEAKVLNVVDGDTYDVIIDLGFDIYHRVRLRLYGIDTPEKNTPEGVKAKDYVTKLLGNNVVEIECLKFEKYGRSLSKVKLNNEDLTEHLIKNGYGKPYFGEKKEKE